MALYNTAFNGPYPFQVDGMGSTITQDLNVQGSLTGMTGYFSSIDATTAKVSGTGSFGSVSTSTLRATGQITATVPVIISLYGNPTMYNTGGTLQTSGFTTTGQTFNLRFLSDILKSKLDAYVHVCQISSPSYKALLAAVYIQLELVHGLSVYHEKPRQWYRGSRIHKQNDSIVVSCFISNIHQQHKWNSLLNHFRLHLF